MQYGSYDDAVFESKPDPTKMCNDGVLEQIDPDKTRMSLRSKLFIWIKERTTRKGQRSRFVKFQPGAYTKWHYHKGPQVLIGITGEGFAEIQGDGVYELNKGTRIVIPPDVLHRHGHSGKNKDKEEFIHLADTAGRTVWEKDSPCDR